MSYRIISGRPLSQEVKRLLDQEVMAVTSELTHSSPVGHARRVHDVRKHIKKARALLQVTRRPLGQRHDEIDEELRTANRALGPLADARRVLETLAAARRDGMVQMPVTDFSALRARLESRATTIETKAAMEDVRGRVVRLIESLRIELATADVWGLDRRALVEAIRDTHADAREARRRAVERPTIDAYHRWRRLVKREWHLLRLVTDLTGDRLRDERHQLAALDTCLGELHDVDVLIGVLAVTAPLPRTEMARVIRRLRSRVRDLRHRAARLSAVLDEGPQRLARRIRALWGSPRSGRGFAMEQTWPHSA